MLSKKIKVARKKANLTQAELAEKIGISAKQLSRIEMASFIPSLITFLKITKVLGLSLDDFDIVTEKSNNPIRDNLIKIINSATDDNLNLYNEIIQILIKNSLPN